MILTKDEFEQINRAVKNAEKTTSGEIATAIINESSDYAFYELAFSLIMGGIYFISLMIFSTSIEEWFKGFFWEYNPIYFTIFSGFTIFLTIGVFYLISNIPVVDRLIIPKKVIAKKVYNRAVRHFIESGTCYTVDRTGVLIFLSIMERKVLLLADKGINDKIAQDRWDNVIINLVDGIKEGRVSDSIVEAVTKCGEILTTEFPIKEGDINELSDDIQVLGE